MGIKSIHDPFITALDGELLKIRAIILAAGTGKRLYPLTKDVPKPLIQLRFGVTILDEQIVTLRECGIDEIVLVTGYMSHKIEKFLKDRNEKKVKIVFNPFFEITNNLISLWMARDYFDNDFIIINGDNIFHSSVVQSLLEEKHSTNMCMVIDRKEEYLAEDMKVITYLENVLRVSKNIAACDANGESIGMIKVMNKGKSALYTILENMVRGKENLNAFWLAAIQQYINEEQDLTYIEIPEETWTEIDFHYDLHAAKEQLMSILDQYHLKQAFSIARTRI